MTSHYVFFSYSTGVGPKTFLKLLSAFGSEEKIYNASRDELLAAGLTPKNFEKYIEFKNSFDLEKVMNVIKSKNIWVLPYKEFPGSLKNISNPPIVLYGLGNKNLLFEKMRIGIVGSRRPTNYGVSVTESFTREFVENNFVIVSGMAFGIDAVAHRTCLKSSGRTIAVLGSGVDVPTPAEHTGLYSEILKNGGGVVSEFPLGMMPNKGSFPARNRIISGLSNAILIPEATSDSGALITAKEAFLQDRKVFVVPGPITSSLSRGTNSLLSRGGIAVGSAGQVLEELEIKNQKPNTKTTDQRYKNLTNEEIAIVKLLENEELSIDEIAKKTKLPISKLSVLVSNLELNSVVKNLGGRVTLYE